MTYSDVVISIGAILLLVSVFYFWRKSRKSKKQTASQLYVLGLKALLAGAEDRAFHNLKQVVRQDTSNVDAYLKLGDLFRKRKQYAKALQLHRELTLRSGLSGEEKDEILESLADDYAALGKHQKAISALRELHRRNNQDDWVIEKLLLQLEEAEMWEEAVEVEAKRLKHKDGEQSKRLAFYKVIIGKGLAKQGELHKARLAYKEALNYDQTCVPAYIYLGDAYYQDRRLTDAIEHWRELLNIVPRAGYLVFDKLEKTLYELGQYGEITEVYSEMLSTNPKDTHTLYALATISEKKGRTDQAIDYYNQILENDPTFLPANLSMIRLYDEVGLKEKTRKLINNLIRAYPLGRDRFNCQNCGHVSYEPLWRCPKCRKWDSFNI